MGKRIYPLNKIKYWYCYDIDEVCSLYKKYRLHPKTVSDWQNKQGLQAIDNKKPALFYGTTLIKFLGKLNEANRCKTKFEHLFCVKCKEGKDPLQKKIQINPVDKKFLKVKAICQTCKSEMNKPYKLDDLQKLKRIFNVVQLLELSDSKNPSMKTPFFDQEEDSKKEHKKQLIQLDFFI